MRITLGVTGGVAAYKAAELVRRLQQEGFSVQVVMTRGACEFVTPLTFAALSGQKVITELFGDSSGGEANLESAIEHIAVAQRTDLLLIAPATADIIAKFARGIADDFLTTLYLASTAPVVVAPAMNVNMWNHAATQENVEMLRARGVKIIEPAEGYLACGMTGPGRLAGQEDILAAVHEVFKAQRDLEGETILVSAGPTCEDLDPVRYISNRSSGKMGYAVAEAAARRGAKVVLISGPVNMETPAGVERIDVRSAEEMHRAVAERFPAASIAILAAAVADYRPVERRGEKIRKANAPLTISLEPTTARRPIWRSANVCPSVTASCSGAVVRAQRGRMAAACATSCSGRLPVATSRSEPVPGPEPAGAGPIASTMWRTCFATLRASRAGAESKRALRGRPSRSLPGVTTAPCWESRRGLERGFRRCSW